MAAIFCSGQRTEYLEGLLVVLPSVLRCHMLPPRLGHFMQVGKWAGAQELPLMPCSLAIIQDRGLVLASVNHDKPSPRVGCAAPTYASYTDIRLAQAAQSAQIHRSRSRTTRRRLCDS